MICRRQKNGKNKEKRLRFRFLQETWEKIRVSLFIQCSRRKDKGKEDKPDTVNLDVSGVAEGAAVYHKSFGKGIVTKMDKVKKHIRVTFTIGEKNFLFPDAFVKGFLKKENNYGQNK